MAKVLVVEDSAVDQSLVGGILSADPELEVRFADHGASAMSGFANLSPDLVLTDLMMPEMDGLELVKAVRREYPDVPVIVMTAKGTEATATEALQVGAASFVPKSRLADRLVDTVHQVLALKDEDHPYREAFRCFEDAQLTFRLDSDLQLIPQFVDLLRQSISRLGICDATESIRLSLAVEEALLNALIHGNLELTKQVAEFGLRPNADWFRQRSSESPYCERKTVVKLRLSPREASFVIQDEGPGFDPSQLPDDDDVSGFHSGLGRGVRLMRAFMNDVSYNSSGTEVTLARIFGS